MNISFMRKKIKKHTKELKKQILSKQIKHEFRIIDGIILTIALLLLSLLNWKEFSSMKLLTLFIVQIYSALLLIIIGLTFKNIIAYRDDIQITIALVLAAIFSCLALFVQSNRMAYSIFTIYCVMFTYIFLRNFTLKLKNKKSMSW